MKRTVNFCLRNNFPVTFIALGLHVVVKTREVDMEGEVLLFNDFC